MTKESVGKVDVNYPLPPTGFLTPISDVTVGGNGDPYGGIGWRTLPFHLRQLGKEARMRNFPNVPIEE